MFALKLNKFIPHFFIFLIFSPIIFAEQVSIPVTVETVNGSVKLTHGANTATYLCNNTASNVFTTTANVSIKALEDSYVFLRNLSESASKITEGCLGTAGYFKLYADCAINLSKEAELNKNLEKGVSEGQVATANLQSCNLNLKSRNEDYVTLAKMASENITGTVNLLNTEKKARQDAESSQIIWFAAGAALVGAAWLWQNHRRKGKTEEMTEPVRMERPKLKSKSLSKNPEY